MDNWYYNEWRYNAEKIIINKNKYYYEDVINYDYKNNYYYEHCKYGDGNYSYGDCRVLKDQKISDSDCRTSSEDERQKALARLQQG